MFGNNLTADQTSALLNKFVEDSRGIVEQREFGFHPSPEVLPLISADLLSEYLLLFKEVDLAANLSAEQVNSTLTKILERNTSKHKIRFYGDLSSEAPDLLAQSLVKMETSLFGGQASLSPGQAEAVFREIALSEELNLTGIRICLVGRSQGMDLSFVDPGNLAKALVRLESVTLERIHLTPHQAEAIFREVAQSQNLILTNLEIRFRDLTDLSSVSRDFLRLAMMRLKFVWILGAVLTEDQTNDVENIRGQRGDKTYWNKRCQ